MPDSAINSFFLPDHLISDILLRLPVRSVIVCTSVCKIWNSIIRSPSFVSSHLNRTISSYKENDIRLYLLQLGSNAQSRFEKTWTNSSIFSLRSDDEELSEYSPLHFPYQHKEGFQVISSCNGLVLLMNGNHTRPRRLPINLILWNPVIRKSIVLRGKGDSHLEASGIGLDSKSGDYKVVTILDENINRRTLKVEVYSLRNNSWKRLPDVEATLRGNFYLSAGMVLLNGVLHFIAFQELRERRHLILGFDLEGEVFHEIELPECMSRVHCSYTLYLWVCGESLSVLWQRGVDMALERQIWVMEEYGVRESWTRVSTVSLEDCGFLKMFGGMVSKKDGKVLMSISPHKESPAWLVSHDLKSHETNVGDFDEQRACYYLGSNYVESLVLLDKGNDLGLVFETDSRNSEIENSES